MIGAMNRYVLYGFVTLLFLGGLFAWVDKGQINALRGLVGMAPLYRSEAADMSAAERAAEIERIAATPVPGILDAPPTLGRAAGAVIACIAGQSGRTPQPPAAAAVRRYLMVLAASGLAPQHPMVEPRLRRLHGLVGQGPMAALETAGEGRLSERERDLLGAFHAAYADPDHPLYDGLKLYGGTFDALDFEAAVKTLAERWKPVAACAVERVLPPLTEWERLAVEQ